MSHLSASVAVTFARLAAQFSWHTETIRGCAWLAAIFRALPRFAHLALKIIRISGVYARRKGLFITPLNSLKDIAGRSPT